MERAARKDVLENRSRSTTVPSPNSLFGLVALAYCLVISIILIQSVVVDGRRFELSKPCICNGTFYRVCPLEDYCVESDIGTTSAPTGGHKKQVVPDDDDHDDGDDDNEHPNGIEDDIFDWKNDKFHAKYDPDHVPLPPTPRPRPRPLPRNSRPPLLIARPPPKYIPGTFENIRYSPNRDVLLDPRRNRNPYYPDAPIPLISTDPLPVQKLYDTSAVLASGGESDRILRHRKIYVAPRQDNDDMKIYPLKIRIPLKLPTVTPMPVPAVPPVFKIKKYTTYESRPEIQMIPVTKTIIKPVGVRPDQIIDETNTLSAIRV